MSDEVREWRPGDDHNADGSLRCNLCGRDPCVCGQASPPPRHAAPKDAVREAANDVMAAWECGEVVCEMPAGIDAMEKLSAALAAAPRAYTRAFQEIVQRWIEADDAWLAHTEDDEDFDRICDELKSAKLSVRDILAAARAPGRAE